MNYDTLQLFWNEVLNIPNLSERTRRSLNLLGVISIIHKNVDNFLRSWCAKNYSHVTWFCYLCCCCFFYFPVVLIYIMTSKMKRLCHPKLVLTFMPFIRHRQVFPWGRPLSTLLTGFLKIRIFFIVHHRCQKFLFDSRRKFFLADMARIDNDSRSMNAREFL